MIYVDAEGNYLGSFSTPPEGGIAVPTAPVDARQTWNGSEWSEVPDTRGYREKRKADYIAEISPEGAFEETSGDAFDAILKYLARKDPTGTAEDPDLGPLLTKINTIKARYPKP